VKILLSSYVFSPSIGGIETVSALLAPEFVKAGHEVILITLTGADDSREYPYQVFRKPSPAKLIELVRWCDVYFQNNISLHLAWPLLFVRRPWVIAHHTWLRPYGEPMSWRAKLKCLLLRLGTNATISRAVAERIPVPSTIVGNPYSDQVYRRIPGIPRDLELVYLGRLVSDKGVDTLLEAMKKLRQRSLFPRLTIIGSGSEEASLRQLSHRLEIEKQITFTGSKMPDQIAQLLNAHQVLVVPSRMPEPFGIVVLEAAASGCVIVASCAGGLPDAVGPCGVTYERADSDGLTDALYRVLTDPGMRETILHRGREHLANFTPAVVARKYLDVFTRALESHAGHV
jgi:glycosyltransferase involved in cell wall biosynthesis